MKRRGEDGRGWKRMEEDERIEEEGRGGKRREEEGRGLKRMQEDEERIEEEARGRHIIFDILYYPLSSYKTKIKVLQDVFLRR